MRADLRRLRDDSTIHMVDNCSARTQQLDRMSKEQRGIGAFPPRLRRREMFTDIAQARRTEQGIGDCVEDDVRVAVAGEAAFVRHLDAA